jgi:hypothetical protein
MEEIMTKLPWWLNLLVKILIVDLGIALFVAVWSWIAKDFTLVALSNRFFVGGGIAILVSLASSLGNYENRSDWRQIFAQSAGNASLSERNQRMIADMVQVYALAFVLVPAGLIAILIAVVLGQLA